MESSTDPVFLMLMVVALVIGAVVGFIATYLWQNRYSRVKLLETELEQSRAEQEAYREKVNQHFQKTAELFEEMTDKYRAVYQHLASSSQDLCGEQPPALQNAASRPRLGEAAASTQPEAQAGTTTGDQGPDPEKKSEGPEVSRLVRQPKEETEMLGDSPAVPKAPEYERYVGNKLH